MLYQLDQIWASPRCAACALYKLCPRALRTRPHGHHFAEPCTCTTSSTMLVVTALLYRARALQASSFTTGFSQRPCSVRAQQDLIFTSPVSRACPTCSTYRSSLRRAHELYDLLRPRLLSGWCRPCSTCSTMLVFAAPVTRVRLHALDYDGHRRAGK